MVLPLLIGYLLWRNVTMAAIKQKFLTEWYAGEDVAAAQSARRFNHQNQLQRHFFKTPSYTIPKHTQSVVLLGRAAIPVTNSPSSASFGGISPRASPTSSPRAAYQENSKQPAAARQPAPPGAPRGTASTRGTPKFNRSLGSLARPNFPGVDRLEEFINPDGTPPQTTPTKSTIKPGVRPPMPPPAPRTTHITQSVMNHRGHMVFINSHGSM